MTTGVVVTRGVETDLYLSHSFIQHWKKDIENFHVE